MLYLIIGVVLLGGGVVGRMWVDRRKFLRRNVAGVEEFKSYSAMVGHRALEALANGGALAVMLVGVLLSIVGIYNLASH